VQNKIKLVKTIESNAKLFLIGPKSINIDGNWDVVGNEVRQDEVIVLTGNLTVKPGGNLTLINTTIYINGSFDGEFGIRVEENGILEIYNDSEITTYNIHRFFFDVEAGALFVMEYSTLSYCGYGDKQGLTIKANDSIVKYSTFHDNLFGIVAENIWNLTLEGNYFYDNYYGVSIVSSNNVIMNGNVIEDGFFGGVQVCLSDYMTITNNAFVHDSLYVMVMPPFVIHYTVEGNTVNGKPLYFLYNITDHTVPKNAGNIILILCRNIIIRETILSASDNGIEIVASSDLTIENNTMDDGNTGIIGWGSSNVLIKGNKIRNNILTGIGFSSSQNITIRNNLVSNTTLLAPDAKGVSLEDSYNVTIIKNEIINNYEGIHVKGGENVNVTLNNIHGNEIHGLYAENLNKNVSAQNNWWGSSAGPEYKEVGDQYDPEEVYGNVSYSPWLVEEVTINIDAVPPSLRIMSPQNESWIHENVDISAEVSDAESGVKEVLFYIDGQLVYTDTNAPYRYLWDTRQLSDGQHTIRLVAYDNEDNRNASEIIVNLDNTPPQIDTPTITPSEPREGDSVKVTVTISDAGSGISHVYLKYRVDGGSWMSIEMAGTGTATSSPFSASIPAQNAGATVEFLIEAYDVVGNNATSTIQSYVVGKKSGGFTITSTTTIAISAIAVVSIKAIVIYLTKKGK